MEVPIAAAGRRRRPAGPPGRRACTAGRTPTGRRSGRAPWPGGASSRAAAPSRSPSRPIPWSGRGRAPRRASGRERDGRDEVLPAATTRSLPRSSATSVQPRHVACASRWPSSARAWPSDRRQVVEGVDLPVLVRQRRTDGAPGSRTPSRRCGRRARGRWSARGSTAINAASWPGVNSAVLDVFGACTTTSQRPPDRAMRSSPDAADIGRQRRGTGCRTRPARTPPSSPPPGHSGHRRRSSPVVVELGRTLRVGDTSTHGAALK